LYARFRDRLRYRHCKRRPRRAFLRDLHRYDFHYRCQCLQFSQRAAVGFTVYAVGGNSSPFGSFETPTDGSLVSSSIPVTGWALDDIRMVSVKIYLQRIAPWFISVMPCLWRRPARCRTGQSRLPFELPGGLGYMMLTHFCLTGKRHIYLSCHCRRRGRKPGNPGHETITCDNANAVKPFGAIDTPAQGGLLSAAAFKRRLGINPLPNTILPMDRLSMYMWMVSVSVTRFIISIGGCSGFVPGVSQQRRRGRQVYPGHHRL